MSLVNVNVPKGTCPEEARRKRSSRLGATARFAQIFQNHSGEISVPHVLIIHEVADYAAWKKFATAPPVSVAKPANAPTKSCVTKTKPANRPFFRVDLDRGRKSVLRIAGLGQNPRRSRREGARFHYLEALESAHCKRPPPPPSRSAEFSATSGIRYFPALRSNKKLHCKSWFSTTSVRNKSEIVKSLGSEVIEHFPEDGAR